MKKQTAIFLAASAIALGAQAQWAPPIFATTIQSQGNMTSGGVINANKGISVNGGPLTVHGQSVNLTGGTTLNVGGLATLNGGAAIQGGLNMTGNVIDGVKADWSKGNSAVNVNQLTAVRDNLNTTIANNATTAANATALVQTNLNTERDARIAGDNDLKDRKADKTALQAEEQARIDGDKRTEQASNTYTDARITQQSGADRAYTDKAVGAERERAMAAEAAISKEVKQVGAMAMAAAGVAGATPQGDKQTAVTAAVGAYSGQTAIAVGVTRLVGEGAKIFGAFSKVSGGKTGVTVGASFSF